MLHQSIDYPLHPDVESSAESLSHMMEQEHTTYSCHDYLNIGHDDDSTHATILNNEHCRDDQVTPADRMRLVDWCYDIVDRCQFERETVAIAMNIVDRFMSSSCASSPSLQADLLQDRAEYQLVTVAALYIAIKMNDRGIFGSKEFSAASRGTYSVEDIEDMEIRILHGLSWRLCPPTSLQMGNRILSLMKPQVEKMPLKQVTWNFIQDEVAFQTENAVRDYYFTTERPSTIAIAAIMSAIDQVSDHDYETLMPALLHIMKDFDFDTYIALLEARDQLHRLTNDHEGISENEVIVSVMARIATPEPIYDSRDESHSDSPRSLVENTKATKLRLVD